MRKTISLLVACILILSVVFTGCTADDKSIDASNTDTTPKEKQQEITIAAASLEDTLDSPYVRGIEQFVSVAQMFDPLIDTDEQGNPIPCIAESWTNVDEDTWEFTIKEGVKFHNGDDLKLSDIVFTFERYKEIPSSSYFVEGIKSVEVSEDNKILIHTEGPKNSLIYMLPLIDIASERAVKELGDSYASNPVGTGPYKLAEFVKGDKIVIERWEDYPFEKPQIKKITFKAIPEVSSRYIALETGEADLALNLTVQEHNRSKSNDKVKSIVKKDTMTVFVTLNCKMEPLDNKLVRQAMSHAIDKESIKILKGGGDEIAHSMMPQVLQSYNDNIKKYDYNIEKAKELLAQAGYENGFDIKLAIYDTSMKSIAELIQANLGEIGINVEIEQLEFGTFLESIDAGTLQVTLARWSLDNLHPSNGVKGYDSKLLGAIGNNAFYVDKEIDKLIVQGSAEMDEEKSKAIYDEIQVMAAESAAYIPLLNILSYYIMNEKLEGVDIKIGAPYMDLSKAYIKE